MNVTLNTHNIDIIEDSQGALTIALPLTITRRSGRQQIRSTNAPENSKRQRPPTALQRALAQGHQWLRRLESGQAQSLTDIADTENIDRSYVSRMLNLTCLAPDIVEAILEDTLPSSVTLFGLACNTPRLWAE